MSYQEFIPVSTASLEGEVISPAAFTAEQVREIDRILINERGIPGLVLMKRAASASVGLLLKQWPAVVRVRVYCGSGNNAADGYIVAGMLADLAIDVEVVVIGDSDKLTADGAQAYQFCQQTRASMVPTADASFVPDVIVDALLGTGFKGELRGAYGAAIESINTAEAAVLALDVPSGLSLDDNQAAQQVVRADLTVTFIALKQGLLTGLACDHVGELYLAPLVDSSDVAGAMSATRLLSLPRLREMLPPREKNAHKFRFGHVLVIGGDRGMGGAPLMTALAAIRSGAGLVSVATHPDHAPYLVAAHPELMIRGVADVASLEPMLGSADVIAMGPGLGTSTWSREMFSAAVASRAAIVLDADGLNILAEQRIPRGNWILTPHPGEARRLLGRGLANRFADAKELQIVYDGVVVLKGAGTLVATKDHTDVCLYGNPGMSTAGMGDVLCGVIAGILGQCRDLELAAKLGVALHSGAADRLVVENGMRGLMATDIIPEVRRLLNNV